jgi:hypothetical protein
MTEVTCSYGDYSHLGYKDHTKRPRDNSMARGQKVLRAMDIP